MVVAVYSCACFFLGFLLLSADEMPETEGVEDWSRFDLPPDAYFKSHQPTMLPTVPTTTLGSYKKPPPFIRVDANEVDEEKEVFNPSYHGSIPSRIQDTFFPTTVKPTVVTKGPKPKVESLCNLERMYVRIQKTVVNDTDAWKSLYFGSCPVNQARRGYYYFLYRLHRCGLRPQLTDDAIVFTQLLRYAPNTTDVVIRTRPFAVPVSCSLSRFHRTYKIGFHPIVGDIFFRNLQSLASASVTAVDENWLPLSLGGYYELEDAMYFEVRVPIVDNQRIFVNRCHMTAAVDPNSIPRFIVIDNFGCMLDSMSSSLSRYHISPDRAILRFTIGAFLFPNMDLEQGLFMHCDLTYEEDATPSAKACTYNRETLGWEELYGNHTVCFCCRSTCNSTQGTAAIASKMTTTRGLWIDGTRLNLWIWGK
ncbi:hypothetical protein AAFF_G00112780 [Aldrovandia affinis]|uniref:ZP domain-containing protein n=1 Tax=Aldrovandia affinis TaxID=143900 RepID=A0AAD7RSZ0_9TELE|nr:hypothetical protein AAFF_G00112780 [Aldrovandia affinis]